MPPPPSRPEALEWQVFRGSAAIQSQLVTPRQLRGKAWLHVMHDVYADARLPQDHALKCTAAMLRLPPGAVLAGPSAAALDGVHHAAGFTDDVHAIVPTKMHVGPQRGIRVHSTDVDPMDTVVRSGIPRTTPARTAWDVAAWLDTPAAVSIIDSLLALRLVTPAELTVRATRGQEQGRRGSRRARQAILLADGRAQSPPESILRVRLVLAGLPPPVPQHPVAIPSGLTLHPDLAWPEFQVAVEYDGLWHGTTKQFHHDRQRLNRLSGAGWLVLHVTSDRLRRDFPGILCEIQQALESRGWLPATPRARRGAGRTSAREGA
jgi:hypothetical protein